MELAKKHGRVTYLRCVDLFLRNLPDKINSRTTDPWLFFITGFSLYLGKIPADDARIARQKLEDEKSRLDCLLAERRRKVHVLHRSYDALTKGEKECTHLWMHEQNEARIERFLVTLTNADRDYIAKVNVAHSLEEMPDDNGRDYAQEYKTVTDAEYAARREQERQEPGVESLFEPSTSDE
jgi:hypothetical protein